MDFRTCLTDLEKTGELLRIRKPVNPRYISPLTTQSKKAVFFEKIEGYDIPVVAGIVGTIERLSVAAHISNTAGPTGSCMPPSPSTAPGSPWTCCLASSGRQPWPRPSPCSSTSPRNSGRAYGFPARCCPASSGRPPSP